MLLQKKNKMQEIEKILHNTVNLEHTKWLLSYV